MQNQKWSGRSLAEMTFSISTGQVRAIEVLEDHFEQIDKSNDELNALVFLDRKSAHDAALDLDKRIANGEAVGPLAGIPTSIKESFGVNGWPTTCGLEKYRGHKSNVDSPAVSALKRADAVLVGKTNVPASLAGLDCSNPIYGYTKNPWNYAHSPGGSSGGSASAVAAGFVGLDLASDLSGSIRVPASWCGVAGFRPSRGFLSKRAHLPWPLDATLEPPESVVGLIARSVSDLQFVHGALNGNIRFDNSTSSTRTKEVVDNCDQMHFGVWLPSDAMEISPFVKRAIDSLIATLTASGVRVSSFEIHQELRDVVALARRITDAEISFALNDDAWKLWDNDVFSTRSYLKDLNLAEVLRQEFDERLQNYDAIICPATPIVAPPRRDLIDGTGYQNSMGGESPWSSVYDWSLLTSVVQCPSVTMPVMLNDDGLPIGIQVFGRRSSDPLVLQLAAWIENLLDFACSTS